MQIRYFFVTILIYCLSFPNFVIGQDIPVIVIAPSKKPQSISTVGSSVVVLDEKFFEKTNDLFRRCALK